MQQENIRDHLQRRFAAEKESRWGGIGVSRHAASAVRRGFEVRPFEDLDRVSRGSWMRCVRNVADEGITAGTVVRGPDGGSR